MNRRVVFDTTTVVSALLFESGRLAWLRLHWQRHCVPLICQETAGELTRVLAYPKFRLAPEDRHELLAEYLPYCKIIELTHKCSVPCRDPKDQPFLNLAQCGKAHILVSGDNDLLALAGHTSFTIETPEAYSRRIAQEGE